MTSTYVHQAEVADDCVITDVTIVDVLDGSTTPHQDLRIAGGIISAIEEHDPSRTDQSIDGAGAFVIPALVDGHAHALNHPDQVDAGYAMMLANGVAGYRQMSGSDDLLRRRAAGTLRQPVGAPRLLALPGDLLTPITAPNPAAAERSVRHQAGVGADFIKAAFTSRDTLLAALEAANEVGLPLAGHVPDDIDAREASEHRMRCMEHLGTGTSLFAAASTEGEKVRSSTRSVPNLPRLGPVASLLGRAFQPVLHKLVVNPVAATGKRTSESYRTLDATFDEQLAHELAAVLRENETWQCATLIRLHTQQLPHLHTDDPRLRYMDPEVRSAWEDSVDRFEQLPEATRETLAAHWEAQLRLLRLLADDGVPMHLGTDANGAGWVIPGFAVHDELTLHMQAGISPLRALQMATIDSARFFGRDDGAGRVAPGFEADLVLLRADPTSDPEAHHQITGVVRDGSWYDRADLDAILERVAADPTAC